MGKATYALGRIALLPAAGKIQTDVKVAKIFRNMTAPLLKLDEVLQCIVLVWM